MISEVMNTFTISPNESLDTAIKKIEDNKLQTLIVIDDQSRVIGTLSDGDIRKALINKRSLLAPVYDVMNTHYHCIKNNERQLAKNIFDKYFYINLIPVINEVGILQDIVYRGSE